MSVAALVLAAGASSRFGSPLSTDETSIVAEIGKLHRLVDLCHLTEKLGAAAQAMDSDSKAADEKLTRWKMTLLNRASAAIDILVELMESGLDEGVGENHPVHAAITYLQTHSAEADRMNYARARRLGLPLGSGNAEATYSFAIRPAIATVRAKSFAPAAGSGCTRRSWSR